MRRKGSKATAETVIRTENKDTSQTKLVFLSFGILLVVALLIWIFVTLWFSAGDFKSAFSGTEALSTVALIGVLLFLLAALYAFSYYSAPEKSKVKVLVLVGVVVLLCTVLCTVCADLLNVYAMPISLCAVLLCLLINMKVALAGNVVLSQVILVVFMIKTPFSAEAMTNLAASIFCNTMSGFVLLYLLAQNYTRIKFILVGLVAGLVMAPFASIVTVAAHSTGLEILYNALWVFVANVISVVLYMPLLPIFESVFNMVTDFKLDELCNFSQPLLKRLSIEAPGTFNHSMIVGNLAENCAIAIGENPHLARAGGYYHDVGKLKNPEFFVENQVRGFNPHDELIPEVSVSMITKHTKNGAQLIREARLPEELADIALQHHGTSSVNYFYYKAQKITEGDLSDDEYCYDGPKPQSKIAAIIMICDTAEAAGRAVNPDTREKLDELIGGLIKEKLDHGQFDECNITMRDLSIIRDTICDVLPSVNHARIKYKK